MGQVQDELLQELARKYIWWKSPDDAMRTPHRIVAQVMNLGDYSDAQRLASELGDEALREVLIHAEPGQFEKRSWTYWHYRLGLADLGSVPPLPTRTLP